MSVALSSNCQCHSASGLLYPSRGVPFSGRKALKWQTTPFVARYSIPSRVDSNGSNPPTIAEWTFPLPKISTEYSRASTQCCQPPLRFSFPGHIAAKIFLSHTSMFVETLSKPASLYFERTERSAGAPTTAHP